MAERDAMSIKLSKNSERWMRRALKALTVRELFGRIVELFSRLGPKAAGTVTKRTLSGQQLARRSGTFARSMVGFGGMVDGLPAMRVGIFKGPALAYAAVHELGTKGKGGELPTVRPRRAKSLAVPTLPEGSRFKGPKGSGRAVTPAGVSRYTSPRRYPGDLVFIEIYRGNVVGALVDPADIPDDAASTGERLQATYLLLRKVDFSPRAPIRKGVDEYLPTVENELADLLRDIVMGKVA